MYRDIGIIVITVTISQCSQAFKTRLEASNIWKEMKSKHDVVKLLKATK